MSTKANRIGVIRALVCAARASGNHAQAEEEKQTWNDVAEWLEKRGVKTIWKREEKKKDAELSERGLRFADWFRSTLPDSAVLVDGWRASWAACFEAMVTLDKRTPEEIHKVCRWARAERFWSGNFLSPLKLRKRDGNNAQFFDRFLAEMRSGSGSAGNTGAAAVESGKHYSEGKREARVL